MWFMRSVILLGLLLGACADEGAHLTLHAPDGPIGATSFQVVLASPDLIPMIANQRTSPKATAVETVTYYLQRTAAGVPGSIDNVDGFTILVEPDASVADTAFIPFVLLYDDAKHLVGVGTYHADPQSPQPSPLIVKRHEVDKFPIDVEPLTEVVDTVPVDPGDSMQVQCARDDQSTFISGVVWRPSTGGELRLLMPDRPDSLDATSRVLDLDCDGHEVAQDASGTDCDDTRARFHVGATELCDGEDWNCDAIQYVTLPCTGTGMCATANMGVALCDDTTGTIGACSDDAACACTTGSGSCTKCVMAFAHGAIATEVSPCQPGVGFLSTEGACENTPCVVSVLGTRNGWQVLVAPTSAGVFGPTAAGVGMTFAIKARRPEGPGFSMNGAANGSVGSADLVIIAADGAKRLLSVDLELASQPQTSCAGNGPFTMTCSP
jgi:hypothetical protein